MRQTRPGISTPFPAGSTAHRAEAAGKQIVSARINPARRQPLQRSIVSHHAPGTGAGNADRSRDGARGGAAAGVRAAAAASREYDHLQQAGTPNTLQQW